MAGRRSFCEAASAPLGEEKARGAGERPRSFSGADARPDKRARAVFTEDGPDGEPAIDPDEVAPKPIPRNQLRASSKSVAELIGDVRPVTDPLRKRLCSHFLKNDCMWGEKCRFSHDPEELRAGAPKTEEMVFSNLDAPQVSRTHSIPKSQLKCVMTEGARQLITNASGVSSVSWQPEVAKVTVSGTAVQVESAEQLIKRVVTHCRWGVTEAKVNGLLTLRPCAAARLTLSPMDSGLKQATFNLTASKTCISLGSDPSNDVTLKGPLVSRCHAVLEFVPDKGSLYVVDKSTNGTFLNGVRLPERASGKVVLVHGDELLFPEPDKRVDALEFGYMVNLVMS